MKRPLLATTSCLLALAGCAGMDQHRRVCASMLGVPLAGAVVASSKTDAPSAPGGPQDASPGAKPATIDPAIEACAVLREERQRQDAAAVAAVILLGIAAGAIAGSTRSGYRAPRYQPRHYYRRR